MNFNKIHKTTLPIFMRLLIGLIYREAAGQTIKVPEVRDSVPEEFQPADRKYNPRKLLRIIRKVKAKEGEIIRLGEVEYRTRDWYVTREARSNTRSATLFDTYYVWQRAVEEKMVKLKSVRAVVLFILFGKKDGRSSVVPVAVRPNNAGPSSSTKRGGSRKRKASSSKAAGSSRKRAHEAPTGEIVGIDQVIMEEGVSSNDQQAHTSLERPPATHEPISQPPPPPVETAPPHRILFDLNSPPPEPEEVPPYHQPA